MRSDANNARKKIVAVRIASSSGKIAVIVIAVIAIAAAILTATAADALNATAANAADSIHNRLTVFSRSACYCFKNRTKTVLKIIRFRLLTDGCFSVIIMLILTVRFEKEIIK